MGVPLSGNVRARAAALRGVPQVQKLLEAAEARALVAEFSRPAVLRALRSALAAWRRAVLDGGADVPFRAERLLASVRRHLGRERRPGLRRVVNATGVVIHTNLGRAPLAPEALAAVAEAGRGYANLEIDLATGRRGSRHGAVEALLAEITGAEAALAVNNNAAAVLLALGALAAGGEVIVSRGELVEIGGSFRVPDIIRQGGAALVEVGTTNRTRASDYERAITPATRVLLKVHPSNYRIVGFTAEAGRDELVGIARRRGGGLLVVEDLGSGSLVDPKDLGLPPEPTVGECVRAGVDLVTFSGDKLLGGPQAGLVVGRAEAVARLRAHPLMRALRMDRLRLAALEATLRLYRDAEGPPLDVPVVGMLAQDGPALRARAERLAGLLAGLGDHEVAVAPDVAVAGGGAMPGSELPTWAVALRPDGLGVEELARRLRDHEPPVVARLSGGALLLDCRTIAEAELPEVAAAVRGALAP